MHRLDGVHEDGAGTRGGQGGGHLLPDVPAFSDARDHELAAPGNGFKAEPDAICERLAQVVSDGIEAFDFDVQDFCCLLENFFRSKLFLRHVRKNVGDVLIIDSKSKDRPLHYITQA